MTLVVLFVDGKGQCMTVTCDECLDQIEEERDYLTAQALHQFTQEARSGRHLLPMWILHNECCVPFIAKHATQGDNWFLTDLSTLSESPVTWKEVNMDAVMDAMKENE